ncbi:hypothetical protein D4R99_03870 [bacterium]|nr:MAG: hypothetical protein D4R99_03870 [bacterium]
MFKKFSHFIQYHNFFTLGITLLFAGASASFAASPDLRSAVIAQNEVVRSPDNAYLINTDFDSYDMGLKIQTVTEDTDQYYIDYTYNSVEAVDYVWKQVPKNGSIKVSKKELEGRDLGLYVADQLGQKIDRILADLKDIQKEQKKEGVTQKVVATEYSGLVGRFLGTDEKVFDGYQPVIPETEKVIDTNVVTAVSPVADITAPLSSSGSISYGAQREPILTREEVRVLIQDAVRNLLSQTKQPASEVSATIPDIAPEAIPAPTEIIPTIPAVIESSPAPSDPVAPEIIPEEIVQTEPVPPAPEDAVAPPSSDAVVTPEN